MDEPFRYSPLGFAATAIGTATAGTLTIPGASSVARLAMIHVAGAAINWRDDGTAPTAGTAGTAGYPMAAGTDLSYDGLLEKFQAIAQAGTANLSISFYG